MGRFVKFVAVVGLVAFGLSFVGESQAGILVLPANPQPDGTSYNYATTIGGWAAIPTIRQQDKDWTLVGPGVRSTTLPSTTTADFSLATFGGHDYHTLVIGELPVGAAETYTLDYNISVNSLAVPGLYLTGAELDSDMDATASAGGVWSVTKWLYNASTGALIDTLVLSNTSPTEDDVTFAGVKSINVVEKWTYDANTHFISTTDTYIQSTIPEPSTLAVWSLLAVGGLGMRVLRRRRGGSARRQAWSNENRAAVLETIESHCSKS